MDKLVYSILSAFSCQSNLIVALTANLIDFWRHSTDILACKVAVLANSWQFTDPADMEQD